MSNNRHRPKSKLLSILALILVLIYIFFPSNDPADKNIDLTDGNIPGISITDTPDNDREILPEDGYYYSLDEVCDYLEIYGHLPPNYITKPEAYDLGWDSDEGNLWEVADGMVIGGDKFGNREGLLPKNTKYYECDVNYYGGYRGDDRIVFSEDGNIYFTSDHYQSFEHMGTFEVE